MEEYGIMEYLELTVPRCGRWTGNREFVWSGIYAEIKPFIARLAPLVSRDNRLPDACILGAWCMHARLFSSGGSRWVSGVSTETKFSSVAV